MIALSFFLSFLFESSLFLNPKDRTGATVAKFVRVTETRGGGRWYEDGCLPFLQ